MKRINLQDFGAARPKLVPDDLATSPTTLTIMGVNEVEVEDQTTRTGYRRSLTITFTEFPEKVFWLNQTQIATLIDRFDNDTDDWIGKPIPVESHVAEFKGQRFPKVRVVPGELWDRLLDRSKPGTAPKSGGKFGRGR